MSILSDELLVIQDALLHAAPITPSPPRYETLHNARRLVSQMLAREYMAEMGRFFAQLPPLTDTPRVLDAKSQQMKRMLDAVALLPAVRDMDDALARVNAMVAGAGSYMIEQRIVPESEWRQGVQP